MNRKVLIILVMLVMLTVGHSQAIASGSMYDYTFPGNCGCIFLVFTPPNIHYTIPSESKYKGVTSNGISLSLGYNFTDPHGLGEGDDFGAYDLSYNIYEFKGKADVNDLRMESITLSRTLILAENSFEKRIVPLLSLGIGDYKSKSPDYNGTGIKLGLGILIKYKSLGCVLSTNYHRIFNDGSDKDFFDIKLALYIDLIGI